MTRDIRDIFILQGNYEPFFEQGDAVIVDCTNRDVEVGAFVLLQGIESTYIDRYTIDKKDKLIGKVLTLVKTLAPMSS